MRCPGYLDDVAKKEWKRLRDLFKSLGENNPIQDFDKGILAVYCQAYSTFVKSINMVDEADDAKELAQAYRIQTKATSEMERFGKLLCLDPISRARVAIRSSGESQSNEDKEAEEFFNG